MAGSIYFVGGASGSGKSIATTQMAAESGLPRLELDGLYDALENDCEEETRKSAMKTVTRHVTSQLLEAGAFMIVEGGWMWPDVAAELLSKYSPRFSAVYCGYPDADAAQRLEAIRTFESPRKHWLAAKEHQFALAWIREQIAGSRAYREAAIKLDLPFFDFSDPQSGNLALIAHFRRWLATVSDQ